jgi:hypothetical protein
MGDPVNLQKQIYKVAKELGYSIPEIIDIIDSMPEYNSSHLSFVLSKLNKELLNEKIQ